MSRLIKLLNNETIEIVEYSKANACFQTNEYPIDELVCVIRETFNPFDLFNDNKIKDMEIERLNNVIKEVREYIQDRYDGEALTHTFDKDNVKELLEILDKEK